MESGHNSGMSDAASWMLRASGAGTDGDLSVLSAGEWSLAAGLAAVLIAVHLLAPIIARVTPSRQDRLASLGGGVAVAYVFVQLMPELAAGGETLSDTAIAEFAPTPIVEAGLFLIALGGAIAFYSIDVVSTEHTTQRRDLYWVHLSAFGTISALYAYTMPFLLTTGIGYAVLFTIAVSAHVLLGDRTLARAHPELFRHEDRWVGIAGVVLGFAAAWVLPPASDLILAIATAFLGGGLLMTTFREELPQAGKARLMWFLLGVLAMAALLIAGIVTGDA